MGFEPTISASERPQTYALDRAVTGTGINHRSSNLICRGTNQSTTQVQIINSSQKAKILMNTLYKACRPIMWQSHLVSNLNYLGYEVTTWGAVLGSVLMRQTTVHWNTNFSNYNLLLLITQSRIHSWIRIHVSLSTALGKNIFQCSGRVHTLTINAWLFILRTGWAVPKHKPKLVFLTRPC